MNKDILFSIIIPIYNTKTEYIDQCVQSLFNQAYKKFEIIIIDDGSSNEIKDFLTKYKIDERITIIHQKNHGQYYSRKKGIELSKGQYILFVDSDDLLTNYALEKLNSILSIKQYDLLTFSSSRFEHSTDNILYTTDYFNEGEITKNEVINELLKLHINGVCLKCVKSQVAKLDNNIVDTSLREGEDLAQSASFVLNSNTFYNTKEVIYLYRFNEELKNYYDNKVDNIDFLMPVYNLFFLNGNSYNEYKPIFKEYSIKAIIYSSFKICKNNKRNAEKKKYIDILMSHDIIGVINCLDTKISPIYTLLLNLLIKNRYLIIDILSKIYYLLF